MQESNGICLCSHEVSLLWRQDALIALDEPIGETYIGGGKGLVINVSLIWPLGVRPTVASFLGSDLGRNALEVKIFSLPLPSECRAQV